MTPCGDRKEPPMNDEKDYQRPEGDFSVASSSMPDRGRDEVEVGIDEALGAAQRDASTGAAEGTDWSDVYGGANTANPGDGPLTADYEALENPGTTTLDE